MSCTTATRRCSTSWTRPTCSYVYRVPGDAPVPRRDRSRAKQRGIPVVFDVDDLIFDPDIASEIPALQILPPAEAEGWLYGVRRYRTTMEHCDGFIGSTAQLVRHAQAVTGLPAARFDNGVGIAPRQAVRSSVWRSGANPVRCGSATSAARSHTTTTGSTSSRPSSRPSHRHPEIELWLGGHLPDSPALEPFGKRVQRIPFSTVGRVARAPAPTRRQPGAAGTDEPVQRSEERDQVVGGRHSRRRRRWRRRRSRSVRPSNTA